MMMMIDTNDTTMKVCLVCCDDDDLSCVCDTQGCLLCLCVVCLLLSRVVLCVYVSFFVF